MDDLKLNILTSDELNVKYVKNRQESSSLPRLSGQIRLISLNSDQYI